MKIKMVLIVLVNSFLQVISACPLCEKQRPKITRYLIHGVSPQSNWDWVIVAIITALTLFTFVFSVKYLIKPGEKDTGHIKQLILNN